MDNSEDYLQKLNNDLIAQFKRQPNTQALMSAVAKQLQSLHEVQEQLRVMRWLSTSEGKQLDGIGDIVVMTRSDAAKLEIGKSDASEVDDDLYRKYLYYKMFLNTSTGTRKEIMKALRFFWDEAPLYYSENPAFPATIFVDTPVLTPDVPIEGLLEAPIVKPAGVRFIVRINTRTDNERHNLRYVGLSVVKVTKTQVSEAEQHIVVGQFKLLPSGLSVVKTTVTEVPEAEHRAENGEFDVRVVGLSVIKNTMTQTPELEREIERAELELRVKGSAVVKTTKTEVSEIMPNTISKQLRTAHSPQWIITHTDTGNYVTVAESTQRHKNLANAKITKTPLAAYGGD